MKSNKTTHKRYLRPFVLLVLVTGLLAGCQPVNPLIGTSWTLVSLNNRDVIPGTEITAVFGERQPPRPGMFIGGNAGCNRYGYPVEVENDKIGFRDNVYGTIGVVTNKLCLDQAGQEETDMMDLEERYLTTLIDKVQSYSLTAERLEMKDENGIVIPIFQKAP